LISILSGEYDLIIDTHAHFVPPTLLADVKAQKRLFPSLAGLSGE
jgi:hypothetical protein